MFTCGSKTIEFGFVIDYPSNRTLKEAQLEILSKGLNKLPPIIYFNSNGQQVLTEDEHGFKIKFNSALGKIEIEGNPEFKFWESLELDDLRKDHLYRICSTKFQITDIYNKEDTSYGYQKTDIKEEKDEICKICFENKQSKEDPLLNYCKCSGSIKFIHLKCLQEWVRSKVEYLQTRENLFIRMKDVKCELCKTEIPFYIKRNCTKYPILDYKVLSSELKHKYNNEFPEYSFQSIDTENLTCLLLRSEKMNSQGIKIIEMLLIELMENEMVNIGKSDFGSSIIIMDEKVEDIHAYIFCDKGKFSIHDLNTKYGTFCKMEKYTKIYFGGKEQKEIFIEFELPTKTNEITIKDKPKNYIWFKHKNCWIDSFLNPPQYSLQII